MNLCLFYLLSFKGKAWVVIRLHKEFELISRHSQVGAFNVKPEFPTETDLWTRE